MSAFDDIERAGDEPGSHLISRADYLNLSGRPEAASVRAFVDQLLDRYPAAQRDALTRRIRSPNDSRHRSGWFELLLHGLVTARGFTVLEIEPSLPGGRSPDFLVRSPDGREFYLEATVAEGDIGADPGADRRLREVLQAVDRVQSADFFIHLHHRGIPAQPVRVSRLRARVQAFLDSLDYDDVVADHAAQRPLPMLQVEEHGLVLTVTVLPKNLRQGGGRAIGGRMLPGGLVNPHVPIKAAVESKAGRYGQLDRPYIVAVSALEEFANGDAAIDALFGTESVVVTQSGNHRWISNGDGAWMGPGGPVNTRVSAVLSAERQSRQMSNPCAAIRSGVENDCCRAGGPGPARAPGASMSPRGPAMPPPRRRFAPGGGRGRPCFLGGGRGPESGPMARRRGGGRRPVPGICRPRRRRRVSRSSAAAPAADRLSSTTGGGFWPSSS